MSAQREYKYRIAYQMCIFIVKNFVLMRTSQELQIRLNLTEHATIYNTGHVMFEKALSSKVLSSISAIHFKLNTGLEGQ